MPILSIPSGIAHLICAIRDRALKPMVYPVPANESFSTLTSRKLDNWSHLKKGILAVIPIIGNAILFVNWAKRKVAMHNLCDYIKTAGSTNRIPSSIFNDKEFLTAALKLRQVNIGTVSFVFQRTSAFNKQDKNFVIDLINKKLIDYTSYTDLSPVLQQDPDVVSSLITKSDDFDTAKDFFMTLPSNLQNNFQVAQAVLNSAETAHRNDSKFDYKFWLASLIVPITNKDALTKSGLSVLYFAVAQGKILFQEVPKQLRKDPIFTDLP